jgi:molybdopterin/thiamine biosynthesis adenylyltransferase
MVSPFSARSKQESFIVIDPLRHLSVFSPHAFGATRIDVIGAGATGSKVVLELAKLGVENIHVWDFDTVEEHNVANQAFGNGHIGLLKVEALAAMVKELTGTVITVHAERVDGTQELGEVVFLLTDTMSSRKEIFENGIKLKLRTKLLVETRMGSDSGRVYAFNPNRPGEIRAWEKTLCGDEEAEVSACGASVSVGPTASIVAGLAAWQMVRWFAIESGKSDDALDNEIVLGLRSMFTMARKF